MEFTFTQQVLLWSFGIAAVMGAVVNKTNFCTMGAVSDLVNIGDTGRFRAWLFAIAIALLGVAALETFAGISLDSSLPPYRTANFAWLRYIVGGVIFGVGMTLGSGCANKTLVRIGGGNLKSIIVLLAGATTAYFMTNPLYPGTDQTLYSLLFLQPVQATTIQLPTGQDLGSILASVGGVTNVETTRLLVGIGVAAVLLFVVFRSADFRKFDNILGGAAIGLAVVGGWFVTAGTLGQQWASEVEWLDQRPIDVGAQSFTFVNPMGETLSLALTPKMLLVSFGVAALAGVIIGSLVYSVVTKNFRLEWFKSARDFFNHLMGGALMGIGGVLAMGCTIGQGVTGVSTMAVGSLLAFGSIVLGSALTMKINYYRLVYEDEASFGKALISSLVDMHLLPSGLRKLDAA